MGNPASDKRKLTEKRRKRHEDRLGPGAYLPKAEREELQAALAKAVSAAEAEKAQRAAAKKVAAAKKAADKAAAKS